MANKTFLGTYLISGTTSPNRAGVANYEMDLRVKVNLTIIETNQVANYTKIKYDYYFVAAGTSATSYSYGAGTYTGGSFSANTMIGGEQKLLGSVSRIHYHNSEGNFVLNRGEVFNITGTVSGGKKLIISRSTFFITENPPSRSITYSWELPRIYRPTTISSWSVSGYSTSQLLVNWATADNIQRVQYQIGSSSWTNGQSEINAKSGNFYIGGLSQNTSYSVKIRVYTKDGNVVTVSGSKTGKTTSAPTSITTYTLSAESLTQIKVSWVTAHNISQIQYNIGGGWINGENSINKKSGNFTIGGLSPGTSYSIRIRVYRYDNGVLTTSSAKSQSPQDIARINSAPTTIDIDTPFTVNFNRNGATTVELGVYGTDGSTTFAAYRTVSGNSYEFTLTPAEKNLLFGDMPTVKTKTYRIYIATNSNTYRSYAERSFTITDANPIFTDFDYFVAGALSLTGDSETIVKGHFGVSATPMPAVAQKGASIARFRLQIGSKTHEIEAGGMVQVMLIGEPEVALMQMFAIDSRGNSTRVDKTAPFVNYTNFTIEELTVNRLNRISEETLLDIAGTYFNGSFGAVSNSITIKVEYKRRGTEDSFVLKHTFTDIDYSGSDWSLHEEIVGDLLTGFDSKYNYDIKIIVEDKLYSFTDVLVLQKGTYNLTVHNDGVAINDLYDEEKGGALQVNGELLTTDDITIEGERVPKSKWGTAPTNPRAGDMYFTS